MAEKKGGRPSRDGKYHGEIDRYHYVDRDIYSSSSKPKSTGGGSRPPQKKRKKKSSVGKRVIVVVATLFILVCTGALVFSGMMLSQLQRDNTDTTSYVQQPSDAPAWEVIDDNEVTNILLIGTDREEDGIQRSDTMMLATIDHKNKKLKLTSFLRDLYLQIPTIGKDKLNSSFSNGGAALTMQTIENNFRVNIDHYVQIDIDSFANVIDRMGGIEVVVNQQEADEMNRVKDCNFSAGKNHMRGTLAVYFARMRSIDSDFGRTGRQRQVIGCMMEKMKSLNPAEATAIMYDYMQYVKTNLSNTEIMSLASKAFQVMDYPMETMHVPNSGTFDDLKLDTGAMVLRADLEKNSALLREFLYGEGGSGKIMS